MTEIILGILCVEVITAVITCLSYFFIKLTDYKFEIININRHELSKNDNDIVDTSAKIKAFNKSKKPNALDDIPELHFEPDEIKIESSFKSKRIGKL